MSMRQYVQNRMQRKFENQPQNGRFKEDTDEKNGEIVENDDWNAEHVFMGVQAHEQRHPHEIIRFKQQVRQPTVQRNKTH